MHPTQSVALVHDRHRHLRATAPADGPLHAGRRARLLRSLTAPARAGLASLRHALAAEGPAHPARPLATRPSDC